MFVVGPVFRRSNESARNIRDAGISGNKGGKLKMFFWIKVGGSNKKADSVTAAPIRSGFPPVCVANPNRARHHGNALIKRGWKNICVYLEDTLLGSTHRQAISAHHYPGSEVGD